MIEEIPTWLKNMPKTDLHCHLGGSIRPSTVLELAESYGISLPAKDEDGLRKLIVCTAMPEKSLGSYLNAFEITESVLVKAEAFERVAYEICTDAHAENVKILELRFAPTNYERAKLKLFEIVEATISGLQKAAREYQMLTGLIVCGIRTKPEKVREAVEIAVNYQDRGVIGFDLAGKERDNRPKQFVDMFKPIFDNFLPVTIHAGEDDTVASVAEAVRYLMARRIGHAITLRESTKLYNYMNQTKLGIEICLTSNVNTGAVASPNTHPVRRFYQDGLRVSINTDNRTVSDTTVTQEYYKLIQNLGFTQEEIFRLAKRGFKSAFRENNIIREQLDRFDEYIARVKD